MRRIVWPLADCTVIAMLDETVGVVPLVIAAVFIRPAGDTEVDQKPRQACSYARAAPELTASHGKARAPRSPSCSGRDSNNRNASPSTGALCVSRNASRASLPAKETAKEA